MGVAQVVTGVLESTADDEEGMAHVATEGGMESVVVVVVVVLVA